MIHKFTIVTVLGTRPEMIRLSKLIAAFDHDDRFLHRYVHTGQNDHPQLRDVFYRDLNLRKPDYAFQARKATRLETIHQMKQDIKSVLIKEKPNAMLVLGDTDSALTAEVAKEMNIPIFHMEAGNRCFDKRSPEEKNRKIIDQIANFNLPYSNFGKDNLTLEKINSPIFITGSPLLEVIKPFLAEIKDCKPLLKYRLEPKSYFIWSTHRAEHIEDDKTFHRLIQTLISVANAFPNKKMVVTTHPRFQKKLDLLNIKFPSNVHFYKPFGLIDYLTLQLHSSAVLSDSGSIHEEADILGFHAVHLRRRHERQEAEVIPICFLSDFKTKAIINHLQKLPIKTPKRLRVEAYREKKFSVKVKNYIFTTLLELNNQKV